MTLYFTKKKYLFCQFSLKYVVLILFFSFIPSEREAAYHSFLLIQNLVVMPGLYKAAGVRPPKEWPHNKSVINMFLDGCVACFESF